MPLTSRHTEPLPACSKRGCSPTYRTHQRWAELQAYAVCDDQGRPRVMLLSEGQMSDYKGAALMLEAIPKTDLLIGDRGYDADWLRQALVARKITACIPSKTNRKVPIPHDTALYRRRHKIEIMFGRLKDWRRIHTRYDRCAHTYMSAIALAAVVIFWL